MHIDFGWEFDGTAWNAGHDSFNAVVAGPRELINLLATRLGLSVPSASQPLRVAAYRSAARAALAQGEADAKWFRASFELNPWAMSTTMLGWRDFLVQHGWTADSAEHLAAGDIDPELFVVVSQRLKALAAVERHLAHVEAWQLGHADLVCQVAARLEAFNGEAGNWRLGISSIALHALEEHYPAVPAVWRGIFAAVETTFGVRVTFASMPARTSQLRIVNAQSQHEAGLTGARVLSASQHPWTILAGASIAALDAELAHRGLPRIGVGSESRAPLIPTLLSAASAPHDLSSLSALLTMSLPGADGPVPLIPVAVSRPLLNALAQQPGLGTPDAAAPKWAEALGKVPEHHQELARELDELLRVNPLDGSATFITSAWMARHLDWLKSRLSALGRAGAYVAHHQGVLEEFRGLVEVADLLTRAELSSIIDCVTATTVASPTEASTRWTVTTHPAQLPLGVGEQSHLLWWAPVDDTLARVYPLTELEVQVLHNSRVAVPTAAELAQLASAGQLAKLTQFSSITAVVPQFMGGEATQAHPLVSLIADSVRVADAEYAGQSIASALESMTVDASSLSTEDSWRLGELSAPTVSAEATGIAAPNPVERRFTPNETLVPQRLSYSQIRGIVQHPLEWLLEYGLGIRRGVVRAMPEGNAMIGTLIHAVHEGLADSVMSTETIGAEFDRLVPVHASALDLPANAALRARYREETVRALLTFDQALSKFGITVTGRENKFEIELPELADAAGCTVALSGFRDVDIDSAGRPGVVDLKYTASKKKFADEIANNEAIQLAVYARSFAADGSTLDQHPVSYYSLAQGRFYPQVGHPVPNDNHTALTDLWERVVSHLSLFLTQLRNGHVFDVDNYRLLREANVIDGQDPTWAELDATFRESGFQADSPHKYTNFTFLTGMAGDYS